MSASRKPPRDENSDEFDYLEQYDDQFFYDSESDTSEPDTHEKRRDWKYYLAPERNADAGTPEWLLKLVQIRQRGLGVGPAPDGAQLKDSTLRDRRALARLTDSMHDLLLNDSYSSENENKVREAKRPKRSNVQLWNKGLQMKRPKQFEPEIEQPRDEPPDANDYDDYNSDDSNGSDDLNQQQLDFDDVSGESDEYVDSPVENPTTTSVVTRTRRPDGVQYVESLERAVYKTPDPSRPNKTILREVTKHSRDRTGPDNKRKIETKRVVVESVNESSGESDRDKSKRQSRAEPKKSGSSKRDRSKRESASKADPETRRDRSKAKTRADPAVGLSKQSKRSSRDVSGAAPPSADPRPQVNDLKRSKTAKRQTPSGPIVPSISIKTPNGQPIQLPIVNADELFEIQRQAFFTGWDHAWKASSRALPT